MTAEPSSDLDAITIAGRPLDPIWLTRIADAVESGIPLSADPTIRHLRDSLRQEVITRTIAARTPVSSATTHPPANSPPGTRASAAVQLKRPGQQAAPSTERPAR